MTTQCPSWCVRHHTEDDANAESNVHEGSASELSLNLSVMPDAPDTIRVRKVAVSRPTGTSLDPAHIQVDVKLGGADFFELDAADARTLIRMIEQTAADL